MSAVQTAPETFAEAAEWEREGVYLPSPEDIQAACREIQSEWTESERSRRARGQAGRNRKSTVAARRFARLLIDSRDFEDRAA